MDQFAPVCIYANEPDVRSNLNDDPNDVQIIHWQISIKIQSGFVVHTFFYKIWLTYRSINHLLSHKQQYRLRCPTVGSGK